MREFSCHNILSSDPEYLQFWDFGPRLLSFYFICCLQRTAFSVMPWNHSDFKLPNRAWKISCGIAHVGCADFLFNGCSIQAFCWISQCSLNPGFGVRVQWFGSRFFFLNRCLCFPVFYGERGFFRGVCVCGGGEQMKEGLNEWWQPEWRMWFINDTS